MLTNEAPSGLALGLGPDNPTLSEGHQNLVQFALGDPTRCKCPGQHSSWDQDWDLRGVSGMDGWIDVLIDFNLAGQTHIASRGSAFT